MSGKWENLKYQDVKITDSIFGAYRQKVCEEMLPRQWAIINDEAQDTEKSYCVENFRVAAGLKMGKRRGVVFLDTDLYKWLEALSYFLATGECGEYEQKADEVIAIVAKAQEKDGYLNTYFSVNAPEQKWTNLVEGHELYTAGHLIEAAVSYYLATGKEELLNVARKNADLICSVFGPSKEQCKGYPGHEEIELALVKLYRLTQETSYLRTAEYFISQRGTEPNYLENEIAKRGGFSFFPEFSEYDTAYSQADIPPVKQTKARGHAVRQMYLLSAMADLAGENEDNELKDACQRVYDDITTKQMYITGGIGQSGFLERFTTAYDLPNSTNYSETCASIGLMMFGQRMMQLTGKASYFDAAELALYNTVLSGMNLEGNRYFYVNPLEVVPQFCTEHTYMRHVKPERQKWFSVACCPPNLARTLGSLSQYIYCMKKDTICINLFISSEVRTRLGDNDVELRMTSDLLEKGKCHIFLTASKTINLKIRRPWYAEDANVRIKEETAEASGEDGYYTIACSAGAHEITIDFALKPVWMMAHDEVAEDAGKEALMKGPVVYCLEEADNGKELSQIYLRPGSETKETVLPDLFPKKDSFPVPAMNYSGIRVAAQKGPEAERLYRKASYETRNVNLKAIPYFLWNNRGIGEMRIWQKILF